MKVRSEFCAVKISQKEPRRVCVAATEFSTARDTNSRSPLCVYRYTAHADGRSASLLIAQRRALEFDALGRLRSQIIRTCARDEGRFFSPIAAHLSLSFNICLFIRILRPKASANKKMPLTETNGPVSVALLMKLQFIYGLVLSVIFFYQFSAIFMSLEMIHHRFLVSRDWRSAIVPAYYRA